MLYQAADTLPLGFKLKFFDAYRPLEFQRMLFEEEYQRTKKANPGLDESEIRKIVFVSVYPPSYDLQKPPPHSTGGAIDLTILDQSEKELDMGSRYCEFGESMHTNYPNLTSSQAKNRLILLNTMLNAGFANFPGEWWHYMYGEREYVAYTSKIIGKAMTAIYAGTKTKQEVE